MTKRAKLIKCDGTVTDVELRTDNLDHMYQLLGCTMVEVIKVNKELDLWVDEEGLLSNNIKPNILASVMCGCHRGQLFDILGDAILVGRVLGNNGFDIADIPKIYADEIESMSRSIQPTLKELPDEPIKPD